jgi:gamma-glutamyl phosphate reductase
MKRRTFRKYGSAHTEAIVTEDAGAAEEDFE